MAIDRREAIQPAFDALLGSVDDIFPIEARDVARAKGLALERPPLPARDAIHVAIMERYEVSRIFSFDRGFDAVPGIRRLWGRGGSGNAAVDLPFTGSRPEVVLAMLSTATVAPRRLTPGTPAVVFGPLAGDS